MTRYIDADAIEYTHTIARSLDDGHNWNEFVVTADKIADMPTLELIHCKDCKFSYVDGVEADGVEPFRACKLKRDSEATYKIWAVNDDDYCSWAEPKDE